MTRAGRRTLQTTLAVLLAVLVPLQGAFACLAGIAGPRHTHTVDAHQWLLEDVRRAPAPRPVEAHVGTGVLHVHATPERHRHAASATLHLAAGEAPPAADDGLAAAAAMAFAFAGSPGAGLGVVDAGAVLMPRPAWAASTHAAAPPERPPRGA